MDRYLDLAVSLVVLFGLFRFGLAMVIGRPTHVDSFNPDAMSDEWRGANRCYSWRAK
jgi:hypothetical protein